MGSARKPLIQVSAVLASSLLLLGAIFLFRRSGELPSVTRNATLGDPPIATCQIGETSWVVSKRDREQYLSDLSNASRQVTLKPVPGETENSVTQLTILNIQDGSPMHFAGFRKDDAILKVNGTPIGTLGRAINLVHEVKAANVLTVQVRRYEQIINYRFEFR